MTPTGDGLQGAAGCGRLAVLYIHGVEADNDRFAETSTALLKKEFTRASGTDADEALVVRTAFWGSVFQERQNELLRRVGANPGWGAFSVLDRLAAWAGRGYSAALLPAVATIAARWLPGAPRLHRRRLRLTRGVTRPAEADAGPRRPVPGGPAAATASRTS